MVLIFHAFLWRSNFSIMIGYPLKMYNLYLNLTTVTKLFIILYCSRNPQQCCSDDLTLWHLFNQWNLPWWVVHKISEPSATGLKAWLIKFMKEQMLKYLWLVTGATNLVIPYILCKLLKPRFKGPNRTKGFVERDLSIHRRVYKPLQDLPIP